MDDFAATVPAPYMTSDASSFAYVSARSRWPLIITTMIDDLSYTVSQLKYGNSAKEQEGKDILSELELLKKSVVCNDQLTPLSDDGEADIVLYNEELRKLGSPTWQDIPWLFCECYMYRRVSTFFTLSTYWKTYDVFANQKTETFRSSLPAVLELAAHSQRWVTQVARGMPESLHGILFNEVFEICLWGNATDLSLLTNLTYEEIQRLQGSEARKRAENNILVNDLGAVYANLNRAKAERAERRVDIVLDNAGFELFVDLLLAEYLLSAGLATTVVLHAKSIPWFVSDVTAPDFEVLFSALQDPQSFFSTSQGSNTPSALSDENRANIARLSRSWSGHLAVGALVVRPSRFWTHPGSFWRMRDEARDLYEDLKRSCLVIFKGDLNYRKLTGDVVWPPTTPFTRSLGPLGSASGINILALRTCKADVVVGLESGVDERLREATGVKGMDKRMWAWSGKWAVCSFSKGMD